MGTIGIEWVNKYHGRSKDLKNNDNNARGFYNKLHGVRQFEYGDDLAWDQDFEESGVGSPTAGTDQIYADNVDIIYFSGHGGSAGPSFGVTKYDSGRARHSEIRLGNRQCEWIVFDACSVLDSGSIANWENVFNGLHGILGFENSCYDRDDRGKKFAEFLNAGFFVYLSWVLACIETEDSDVSWAFLFAQQSVFDCWHGKGSVSSDPIAPTNFIYLNGPC
ncbi:MAG: DUF6345 domain-containing protein [Promethearchaeota archaeon]